MKLVGRIAQLLPFRKKATAAPKRDVSTALDSTLKQEIAQIAGKLKSERVSVRGLHAGEIPSDTPEIEEKPF